MSGIIRTLRKLRTPHPLTLLVAAAVFWLAAGRRDSEAPWQRDAARCERNARELPWTLLPQADPGHETRGRPWTAQGSAKRRVALFLHDASPADHTLRASVPMLRLAKHLAISGHDVSVVTASPAPSWPLPEGANVTWDGMVATFASEHGLRLLSLPQGPTYPTDAPYDTQRSYEALLFLKSREDEFDVVHFPDRHGLGFFPLLARNQGTALGKMTMVVHLSGPSVWGWSDEGTLPDNPDALESNYLEMHAVQFADYVVSPSYHMRDWIANAPGPGWRTCGETVVAPPLLDADFSFWSRATGRPNEASSGGQPNLELVFPPLVSYRSVMVILDALKQLLKEDPKPHFTATLFVDMPPRDLFRLSQETQNIPQLELRYEPDLNFVKYSSDRAWKRLLVLPCDRATDPFLVAEAAASGGKFLVCDCGGSGETLSAFPGHGGQLFSSTERLANLLSAVIVHETSTEIQAGGGHKTAVAEAWNAWHGSMPLRHIPSFKEENPGLLPLISIIMTTYNRDRFLVEAVESILAQDYPNIELILVDDASTKPEALAELARAEALISKRRGWQVLRLSKNGYLGEARNQGRKLARGKVLMFMDDDNLGELFPTLTYFLSLTTSPSIAVPTEVSTFWNVMYRTRADACSCLVSSFYTDKPPDDGLDAHLKVNGTRTFRWLPVGGAAGVGAFKNRFGDANFFIRADVFDALGGFTRDRLGFEDWEFLSGVVAAGYRLEVVAEPLFWKRELKESMMHTMDRREKLRGTLRAFGPYLRLDHGIGTSLFAGKIALEEKNGAVKLSCGDSAKEHSGTQGMHSWLYGYRTKALASGVVSSFTKFEGLCGDSHGGRAAYCLPAAAGSPLALERTAQTAVTDATTAFIVSRAWISDEVGNATISIKLAKQPKCRGKTLLRTRIGNETVYSVALEKLVLGEHRETVEIWGLLDVDWLVELQVEALEAKGCHRMDVEAKLTLNDAL